MLNIVDIRKRFGQVPALDELLVEGTQSALTGELAFNAGLPLHELVPEASSLEDAFLEPTTKEPS